MRNRRAGRLPLRGFAPNGVRIPELDFLRGFCVLLMIFDHLCLDFMWLPIYARNFFRTAPAFLARLNLYLVNQWWGSTFHISARLCVVSVFFCISGICTAFSRNNFIRSAKLAFFALLLSLATFTAKSLLGANIGIAFGVLHCLAASVLIFALLDLALKGNSAYACIALGLFLTVWGLMNNFYALENTAADLDGKYLGFVGFLRVVVGTRVYGSDCAGLLPYAGILLIGAAGGKLLYADKRSKLPFFGKLHFRPVTKIGRHALIIYLVHQPILLLILLGIFSLMGVRFTVF